MAFLVFIKMVKGGNHKSSFKISNRYKYLLINKYHNKKLDETIESKELKKNNYFTLHE